MRQVGGTRQPWKRWWTKELDVEVLSRGILRDPDGEHGKWLAPGLTSLADHEGTRCLVLLGDAGSGKSDELEREADRWVRRGRTVLSVDLGAQPDREALERAILQADETVAWMASGANDLILLLDGVDEARTTITKLPEVIDRILAQLPTDRLLLRITCRPSAWPSRLESKLTDLWTDGFDRLTLAPLTAKDISATAAHVLGDGNRFLEDVLSKDLGPLAARPLTLGVLLNAAMSGELPSDRTQLYQKAVKTLVAEQSDRRAEARPRVPLARLLDAAERLATVSMLAGLPVIDHQRVPDPAPGVLYLDDIDSDSAELQDTEMVLESALLSANSGDGVRWSHRSLAEFLCARRMVGVPLRTQLHLLTDPGEPEHFATPLIGVVAWLAALSPEFFDSVVEREPEILLTADLVTATVEQRRRVARAVIADFGTDSVSTWPHRSYANLHYPELASDLEPLLAAGQPTRVRVEAVFCVFANHLRDLDEELIVMIEGCARPNTPDIYDAEVQLANFGALALVGCGRPAVLDRVRCLVADPAVAGTTRAELLDVLLSAPGDDQSHELDLLEDDALSRSDEETARRLAARLASAVRAGHVEAVCVLPWLLGHTPSATWRAPFVELGMETVRTALLQDDVAGLDDATWMMLGELCIRVIDERYSDYGRTGSELVEGATPSMRRRLAEEALRQESEYHSAQELQMAGLLLDEDLEWWLRRYAAAGDEPDALEVARIALDVIAKPTPSNIALVAALVHDEPGLEGWFKVWSSPDHLRHWAEAQAHQRNREAEEARRLADRYFSTIRLGEALESGSWQTVISELSRDLDDPLRRHVHQHPVVLESVWKTLDEGTRRGVVELAIRYLVDTPAVRGGPSALAGEAYATIVVADRQRLEEIDVGALLAWLPHILDDGRVRGSVEDLLETLRPDYPGDVETLVLDRLDQQVHRDRARIFSEIGSFTTPAIENALARYAEDPTVQPSMLADLLDAMFDRDEERAFQLVSKIMSERPASQPPAEPAGHIADVDRDRWDRAVIAASTLVRSPALETHFEALLEDFTGCATFASDVIQYAGTRIVQRNILLPGRDGDVARPELRRPWAALSTSQLATLYLWAHDTLPAPEPGAEPFRPGSPDGFADMLFSRLRQYIEPAAVDALERIASVVDEPWARIATAEIRAELRDRSYEALKPSQITAILSDPSKRVARSEAQLAEIILDAIDDLSEDIQTDHDLRSMFWHRQRGTPPTFLRLKEVEFTTRFSYFLRLRLQNVVIRQEAQLNLRLGRIAGAEPDIEVLVQQPDGSELCVFVEVKGSWHTELLSALETQLTHRYLTGVRSQTGIYLVPWFAQDAVAAGESSGSGRLRRERPVVEAQLLEQAAECSRGGKKVHVRIVEIDLDRGSLVEGDVGWGEASSCGVVSQGA
jgi:hypothetical protein